ncbi:MAG: hypothetical protein GY793_02500 [Proteobacteria bacterium]|nr:hypothetical protein [Pseudomonadota bacterium]
MSRNARVKTKTICHSGDHKGDNPESMFCFKLSNFSNDQKAAMFGLDARVALAIFGALSVIVGGRYLVL